MHCALNTQTQERFTIWAKNSFYIVSKIYSFEARIFEYDRKFCCGWKLETSTFDPQMSSDFFGITYFWDFFQVKVGSMALYTGQKYKIESSFFVSACLKVKQIFANRKVCVRGIVRDVTSVRSFFLMWDRGFVSLEMNSDFQRLRRA